MIECYWWVGSLSPSLEYFQLLDHAGRIIYPNEEIISSCFNIKSVASPVNMSIDGEVAFDEFAVNSSMTKGKDSSYSQEISDLRVKFKDALVDRGSSVIEVSRENIFEDLISAYKKRGVCNKELKITFIDEDATGDGVTRDAYTSFFQKVYDLFEGNNEKIPPIDMDEATLDVIGKIITHSFVQYTTFPHKICIVALKNQLFEKIDPEELLQSYLNYLPRNEADLIKSFATNQVVEKTQHIIDILSESRVFANPSKDNVYDLCKKAAHTTLVKLPFCSMKCLVGGMGSFWTHTTEDMLNTIFSEMIATPEKVISALQCVEMCHQDATITTFLHRFIRSASRNELDAFLRFSTGCTSLIPGEIIKVTYFNQTHSYLAPTVATCFKIINIPRGYSSFAQFRENILLYLSNNHSWSIDDN